MSTAVDISGHADMVERVGLYDAWEAEFKPLLGHTPRWEGFSYIVRDQLERERVCIVETGTLRQVGNWAGDGQSTAVWDWIARQKDVQSYVLSCDVSHNACQTAKEAFQNPRCRTRVIESDSVTWLRSAGLGYPTLLYLDSYDYRPGDELNACMHQVAELAAVWERLPSGCLIASDDSHNPDQGKPALTRRLLAHLGIQPILDSYIVIWRKP